MNENAQKNGSLNQGAQNTAQNRSYNQETKEKTALGKVVYSGEVASEAMAESERALIESAYVMATKYKRNENQALVRIKQCCQRLTFAETATYSLKRWDSKQKKNIYIKGLSIRSAEEFGRLWGNIFTQISTIYDGPEKRIIQVKAIDLETNYVTSGTVITHKSVERSNNKYDREVLDTRLNSEEKTVFILKATEQEVWEKSMAAAQKLKRNLILNLLPGDIKEEAFHLTQQIVKDGIDKDPEAAKKRILDGFSSLNIMPVEIEKFYSGQSLDTLTPDQIKELRNVYSRLKDGVTTWPEELNNKLDEQERSGNRKEPNKANLDDFKPGDQSRHTHPGDPVGQPEKKSEKKEKDLKPLLETFRKSLSKKIGNKKTDEMINNLISEFGVSSFDDLKQSDKQEMLDELANKYDFYESESTENTDKLL